MSADSRLLVGDVGTMITECLAGTGIAQMIAIGAKEYLETGQLDASKNLSRRRVWADSLVEGRLGVKQWAGSRGSST